MNLSIYPNQYYPDIYSIDYEQLRKNGIKFLLIDVDGTIISESSLYRKTRVSDNLKGLFCYLKQLGFTIALFSNGFGERIDILSNKLDVDAYTLVNKPFKKQFTKAMSSYNFSKDETAIIGNDVFDDIIGGNNALITTVLVNTIGGSIIPNKIKKLVYSKRKEK